MLGGFGELLVGELLPKLAIRRVLLKGFTGLARESAVDITMRVYSVATGALVHETAALTTDSNGRLARYETGSVATGTAYHLMFIRDSDGEVCAGKMTAT